MNNKDEKKNDIRNRIIEAAEVYSTELAGKTFLYVGDTGYLEVSFEIRSFLHLTGVETSLSAKDFYMKAKNGSLSTKQFYFSERHPYSAAKKKLTCLGYLPSLTSELVCIIYDMETLTMTYDVGITNLNFTVGFTEKEPDGEKVYVPRTLRVKDKAVDSSGNQKNTIVDFIFVRDAAVSKYSQLVFRDKNAQIPDNISHLIAPEFYIKPL